MKPCLPPGPLKKGCSAALLLGLLTVSISPAAESQSAEAIFSGFDDSPTVSIAVELETEHLFSGYAKLATTYNFAHDSPAAGQTDWRGLSRLRTELQVEYSETIGEWKFFADGKFFYDFAYGVNGRGDYTDEVLDAYEKELELRELFVQGTLSEALDLKLGRQVVVWGRSDNFRVTDIVNPLDNREPGLTDIEDLRLPLVMSKFDSYVGNWNLDFVAIHEHRFDKNPPLGHDFYPSSVPLPPEEKPAHTLENTEYAAELKGSFAGWDLSGYWARMFNDQPDFRPSPPTTLTHAKISMYGAAMSIARGNLLYIAELAHLRGLHFMADPVQSYNRTDFLAGIEYQGFAETVVGLEYVNRHLHGYNEVLAASPEQPRRNAGEFALRLTNDRLRDTLHLTAVLYGFGEKLQNGGLARFAAAYDLADAWSLGGGLVFYQSGNRATEKFGDNDRLFMELRYDF